MQKKFLLALPLAALTAASFANTTQPTSTIDNQQIIQQVMKHPHGLNKNLLALGLKAYQWAEAHGHVTKPYLAIADLSIPSKKNRFWVINLKTKKIIFNTLVANGKGSGLFVAKHFSNRVNSDDSSLGVYTTGSSFYGDVGYSMYLNGLQPGINSNARRRLVVVHSNWYVSKAFADKYGRVGRSLGCFTLSKKEVKPVINTIKNGSVLYAYAANQPDAVRF